MRVRESEAKNIQKKLQIIIDSECFNDLGIIYAIKNIQHSFLSLSAVILFLLVKTWLFCICLDQDRAFYFQTIKTLLRICCVKYISTFCAYIFN